MCVKLMHKSTQLAQKAKVGSCDSTSHTSHSLNCCSKNGKKRGKKRQFGEEGKKAGRGGVAATSVVCEGDAVNVDTPCQNLLGVLKLDNSVFFYICNFHTLCKDWNVRITLCISCLWQNAPIQSKWLIAMDMIFLTLKNK